MISRPAPADGHQHDCDSLRGFGSTRSDAMRSFPNSVRNLIVTAGLAGVVSACAPPPAPDTRAQDEAAIRAAETAWSAAAQAKDLEKAISFYAPDAIVLPPNEPRATSAAEIRKSWEGMLAMPGMNL